MKLKRKPKFDDINPSIYRVRGASVVVPDDVNWIDGVREAITVPPA